MSITIAIGQHYIDFIGSLSHINETQFKKEVETLFSTNVKKVVNSRQICNNRNELVKQMSDIVGTYGISKINLLELIVSKNEKVNVLRFEITYNDNTTESVITILKYNDANLMK